MASERGGRDAARAQPGRLRHRARIELEVPEHRVWGLIRYATIVREEYWRARARGTSVSEGESRLEPILRNGERLAGRLKTLDEARERAGREREPLPPNGTASDAGERFSNAGCDARRVRGECHVRANEWDCCER